MSQVFNSFDILNRIIQLMQHEQFIIQSDAQKTFDCIFKGPRIYNHLDRKDGFIDWVDRN